jgi:hypothetical protein
MEIVKHVLGVLAGKHSLSDRRSDKWPEVRKKHLETNPTCSVCGGSDKLEVHHIAPFHLNRELELLPHNLITLCESKKGGVNCHLWFGHLGNYKSYNIMVQNDSKHWNEKFKKRP